MWADAGPALGQRALRDRLAQRLAGIGPLPDPGTGSLAPALAAVQERAPGPVAVTVLTRFDLAEFAAGTLAFTLGLDPAARRAWYAAFTRTVHLAGNPAALADRYAFAHLAPGGRAGWLGPFDDAVPTGLRRLLRTFPGAVPAGGRAPVELRVPGPAGGPGRRRLLRVATAGLSRIAVLGHLGHALSESAVLGLLRPGDELRVEEVAEIEQPAVPPLHLRVHLDTSDDRRLRAYAALAGDP